MALEIGSRLGHYDVTALIGDGGMGQVYQATATKLKRQVALKILPEAFSADTGTPSRRTGPSSRSTSTLMTASRGGVYEPAGFFKLMNALKPAPPVQGLIMSEESRLGREAIETTSPIAMSVRSCGRGRTYVT